MNDSQSSLRSSEPGTSRSPTPARILLVGARRDARELLQHLEHAIGHRLNIMGLVDARRRGSCGPHARGRHLAVDARSTPIPVLGGIEHLDRVVDRTRATDLVVAFRGRTADRLGPHLTKFTSSRVRVHWVRLDGRLGGGDAHGPGPARRVEQLRADLGHQTFPPSGAATRIDWQRAAKRLLDVGASLVGLLLLSPLFLVVAAAIWLTSGRPIFYSQERVGQSGRRFRILKFRSMRTDAERETGPVWASNHDSRCTRIGDWLRRSNIDELPQLLNVLAGDMSLVGPRPERPVFVDQFREAIPDYDLRHAVPSGMTGWAQVHGWRGRTSLRKRIQYDLDYIERWSFWLDLRILVMTIQHVAWGKTSWNHSRPEKRSGT